MDTVDGIDCIRERIIVNQAKRWYTNGKDDLDDGAVLEEEIDICVTDIESQIVGPEFSPVTECTEIRVKHPQNDCERGDSLGGYLVSTKKEDVYHHMFQCLSQTGLLYTKLGIQNGNFLLKLNDEETDNMSHKRMIQMFESLKLGTTQSMVTEEVKIEFTLIGFSSDTSELSAQSITFASTAKGALLIQTKGTMNYLSVRGSLLTFGATKRACREGHICHFFRERMPNTRKFRLKAELRGAYVGFKKVQLSPIEAKLLDTPSAEYYTELDFVYDCQDKCWKISFTNEKDSKEYFLQEDKTTKTLVALSSYEMPIDVFPAKC